MPSERSWKLNWLWLMPRLGWPANRESEIGVLRNHWEVAKWQMQELRFAAA